MKDGDKAGWNYVAFSDEHIRVDHKWTDGQMRYSVAPVTLSQRGDWFVAEGKDAERAAKVARVQLVTRNGKQYAYMPERDINTRLADLIRNGVGVNLNKIAALAARMVTGARESLDKAPTTANTYGGLSRSTVEGYLRRVKPSASDSEIALLLDTTARRARDMARAMREDLDRGVSESAVVKNLDGIMRDAFGAEMGAQANRGINGACPQFFWRVFCGDWRSLGIFDIIREIIRKVVCMAAKGPPLHRIGLRKS